MPGCSIASARAPGCSTAWRSVRGRAIWRGAWSISRPRPTPPWRSIASALPPSSSSAPRRRWPISAPTPRNGTPSARSMSPSEVEAALQRLLPAAGLGDLLDIGTGTGRVLELFAPQVERAVGIDLSREMLAVARVNLERANLRNCSLRQADMYQLPLPGASFDAVVIHQVLHYAERPAQVIAEAARVLRPEGRLVIVDFAPHDLEFLRTEHAHRRLGFGDAEVVAWC